jgi:hypothetical protein
MAWRSMWRSKRGWDIVGAVSFQLSAISKRNVGCFLRTIKRREKPALGCCIGLVLPIIKQQQFIFGGQCPPFTTLSK